MKISDCMTRKVRVIDPELSLREAAQLMADLDAGVLPVGDNDRLVGVLTDRDIAIRAIACNKGPDTKVSEVVGEALGSISRAGGMHSQGAH